MTSSIFGFVAAAAVAFAQTGDDGAGTGPGSAPATTDIVAKEAEAKALQAYWAQVEAAEKAKKAAIEAEVAAVQAKFGAVKGQTAITGSTTAGTDTGKAEAMLLATRAAGIAAVDIDKDVRTVFGVSHAKPTRMLLVSGFSELSLADLHLFEFRRSQIERSLTTARAAVEQAIREAPAPEPDEGQQSRSGLGALGTGLTGIGAAIDLASKIGSYFLSDYSFAGAAVVSPDNMMAYAVAHRLRDMRIAMPSQLAADEVPVVIDQLAPLADGHQQLVARISEARARAAELKPAKAAGLNAAITMGEASAKTYTDFIGKLLAVSDTSGSDLEKVLRQNALRRQLDGKTPILVLNEKTAGAYYTKKNLWTFLGGPPLYTMGGIAVSYALLDGERRILTSGTVAKHGGYRSVRDVEKLFK